MGPVKYIKKFVDSLQFLGGCFADYWNYWMFGVSSLRSDGSPEQNKKECTQLFGQLDASGDGFISEAEIKLSLERNSEYQNSMQDGDQFKDLRNDAESFIRLNDEDADGLVSALEYLDTCKLWS